MSLLKWIIFPKTSLRQHWRKAYEKSKIERRNQKLDKLQTENAIREEKLRREQLKQELKKLPWYKRL